MNGFMTTVLRMSLRKLSAKEQKEEKWPSEEVGEEAEEEEEFRPAAVGGRRPRPRRFFSGQRSFYQHVSH